MPTYKSIFRASILLILVILVLSGCSQLEVTIKTNSNTTDVSAGEEVSIAAETKEKNWLYSYLWGVENSQFEWQAEKGSLSGRDGPSVIYTAPNEAGSDKISVVVTGNSDPIEKTVTFTVQADPTTTVCQQDSSWPTLRILQTEWDVFVPGYDDWFDQFAKEWGCDNKVNVVVDHIGLFNIAYCLEAEIAEYKGEPPDFDIGSCFNEQREDSEKHDLIEMVLPPHQFAPDLVDLTNFMKNIKDSMGNKLPLEQQARICLESSSFIDEETNERKYIGFCPGWVPELSLYRRDLWETDFPDGPSTYLELLDGGAAIKEDLEGNIKVVIPLRPVEKDPALDVNNAIRAIFWSFGAYVQDENQNVVIDSDETKEAIKYMVDLYIEAMDPSVLKMNDESNNVCLAQNLDCSYIINAISAYLLAQKEETDGNIVLAPPPSGPVDALAPPHLTQVYVMPDFINSNQQARAEDFLQAFIMNYQEVMKASQLYTLSAWPNQFPIPEELLDDKTKVLKEAITQEQNTDWLGWTRNIGYPGPTNAAVVKVFRDNILPNMVGNVAHQVFSKPGITEEEYENIIQDQIDKAKKGDKTKEGICAIFLDPETRPKQDRIEGCE